jgi:hypothetical protein
MLPFAGFLLCQLITLFCPQQGGWSSCFLMGAQDLYCSHSGEHWVSVHCVGQASQHQQSSRFVLSGGTRNSALGQERYDCSAGKYSVKHWACVPWGNGFLVPPTEWQVIAFLPEVGNLAFLLFSREARALLLLETVGRAGLQCSVGKEASWHQKIAKPGTGGSLGHVVVGSWN